MISVSFLAWFNCGMFIAVCIFASGYLHKYCGKNAPMVSRGYTTCFAAGWFFSLGQNVWLQDMAGKEKFIEYIQEHWVTTSPIVGAAFIAMALFMYWKKIKLLKVVTQCLARSRLSK